MRQLIVKKEDGTQVTLAPQYVCDVCGRKSFDELPVCRCEAWHRNMPVNIFRAFNDCHQQLKKEVEYCSSVNSRANNAATRADLDKAVQALLDFEAKYPVIRPEPLPMAEI